VQEIRKQAIQDAAYVVTDYLISEGKRSDCAPIMTRLAMLADNPAKP
jgi:hypothetical protein